MFCDLRASRLLAPMPPTPMPAMFSFAFGAASPAPSTWRGTTLKEVTATALAPRKRRRVMGARVESEGWAMEVFIQAFFLNRFADASRTEEHTSELQSLRH